jgi:hypothetical protein
MQTQHIMLSFAHLIDGRVAAAVPSLPAHHIGRRVQPHAERVRALFDLGARDDAQAVEDGRARYLCVRVCVRAYRRGCLKQGATVHERVRNERKDCERCTKHSTQYST